MVNSFLLPNSGIENKVVNNGNGKVDSSKGTLMGAYNEEDSSENSYECVICMSDLRDTLILPCRHLCLCKSCANSLRYQANNCPICRVPFRALLQIKAVRRQVSTMHLNNTSINNCSNPNTAIVNNNNVHGNSGTRNNCSNMNSQQQIILSESLSDLMVDIPPGFEIQPLVEALNGVNPQSYLGSLQKQHHQSANLELDLGDNLSPERHVIEKGGPPLGNGGDLEAAVVAMKRTGKKKSDASIESVTNAPHRVSKIDIDPTEDSVSFSKKNAHDEYNIKYFYNSSKAQKTSQTKSQQQQQQPKYSSVTTVSPATDDSVSASSSSSGNVEVGVGVGSAQERTRLLRKSSKANTESAPVVVPSTREVETCNRNVSEERSGHHQLPEHHHRHHTSQSSDSCEGAVLHASLDESNGGEETPPIELGEMSHLKGLHRRSLHEDP